MAPEFWGCSIARVKSYNDLKLYLTGNELPINLYINTYEIFHVVMNIINVKSHLKILISKPKYSEQLAEFVGILLGDGSISKTNYSIEIVLNIFNETPYVAYLQKLINSLFSVQPRVVIPKNGNTIRLRINSRDLFEFLMNIGMSIGTEEKKIPDWVFENEIFLRGLIRGLFDTDGSVFLSSRWCVSSFTSNSSKMRMQFKEILDSFGIPTFITKNHVSMTSLWKIKRFMNIIGTSNLKNVIKFIKYIRDKETVKSNDLENLFKVFEPPKLPYFYKGVVV